MLYPKSSIRCFAKKSIIGLAVLSLQIPFVATLGLAQTQAPIMYPIIWQFNVKVSMRDDVKLSTDIIRPDIVDRFPVILIRTPYDKGVDRRGDAVYFAHHGYVTIVQDVRGRHDSEGDWEPFFHEADDGYDTQQWAARQSWSNGKVITFGSSYEAMVQWLAATRQNPQLKAMVSIFSPSDLYEGLFYVGGAFQEAVAIEWATFVDGRVNQQQEFEFAPWSKAFNHRPVTQALEVVGRNPIFYHDWLAHPAYDAYWERLRWRDSYEKFNFPVLNIGGWFDIFQGGAIDNFQRSHPQSSSGAREAHRLIIGPWTHSDNPSRQVGAVDFGPESVLSWREITLRWLDHNVKGIENGVEKEAPVKLFTMGENTWHEYSAWPVPGTQYVKYYLRSEGHANSSIGDGLLAAISPPSGEKSDRYAYDPGNPVPNAGGGNCCWPEITPWGPYDQRSVERRDDVLVYTSPLLEEDLRVTGPVVAKLWIESSARDTDFTVKLVDVYPNGFAMNLTDGILRARFRSSFESPKLLEPGRPYELTIPVGSTSNLFRKGHNIRVEIASSNFPRFSRSANTAEQPEAETAGEVAQQTILHDAQRASYVELPVLAR
jgi:uncharacterized protein